MTSSQERVQSSADHLYNAMGDLSKHLDNNGAKLDDQAKRFASVFDREMLVFLNQCNLHSSSVSAIRWGGQTTALMGLLMSLRGFTTQVNQLTGFKFHSLEWFNK